MSSRWDDVGEDDNVADAQIWLRKYWGLLVAGIIVFFLVTNTSSDDGGGPDCYTDWDGRNNPTVCD